PHRRLEQVEQVDRCYCRRSPSRARVRTAIKVYGGYVPAAEFAGVEVDDPVAPSPAAAIGDATINSVGHCPSSIVAPNRDQQFR
ncbi:MAG: hypothetical protein WA642_13205, partial [Steroidobacteraceae bacterium]